MKTKKLLLTAIVATGLATASLAQTVPSYVPTNGLVGWWPFNGNAVDESINTNDGTVNGAILTTDRFGNSNSAYSFDGVNDNIIVQNNPQINPTSITISGWINNATNNQNGAKGIITKWYQQGNCNNNSDNYTVILSYVNNSSLLLNATLINSSSSTALNSINNVVGVNSWKFFTFVHDATIGQKIYIDGVSINSNNITGTLCYTTNNLIFGADNQFGTLWRFFNGKLDDIGIWNRALTEQEITDLYNGSSVGVAELKNDNLFSVYPNPAKNQFNIKADVLLLNSNYTLYDYTGKLVLSGKLTLENSIIDLNNLSQGIYLLTIGDNKKQIFKIVKD